MSLFRTVSHSDRALETEHRARLCTQNSPLYTEMTVSGQIDETESRRTRNAKG